MKKIALTGAIFCVNKKIVVTLQHIRRNAYEKEFTCSFGRII